MKTTIVKRRSNHIEPYDERKLYESLYASCLAVKTPSGEAELTAKQVCKDLLPWLIKKTEVTSHDIRIHAADLLRIYNTRAAYMYKHHGILY